LLSFVYVKIRIVSRAVKWLWWPRTNLGFWHNNNLFFCSWRFIKENYQYLTQSVGSICVLSGRGLCGELITRPEESYQLWCIIVCDIETSWIRRPWPTGGCRPKNKQTLITDGKEITKPLIMQLSPVKTADNCIMRGLRGRE
jgi:hypothetical protein